MKKKLAIFRSCVILSPVSERNTKMNTTNIIDRVDSENANLRSQLDRLTGKTEATVLVSCCGCGEELHISHEEADQWTDTDWFQCRECE